MNKSAKDKTLFPEGMFIIRTYSRLPQDEFDVLSNNRPQDNILTTSSTAVIPDKVKFSSISAMDDIENKWANKRNLIYNPTKEETLSRTGTTIVLMCPASLHSCRTSALIDQYNLEDSGIKENLFKRSVEFGKHLEDNWDKNALNSNNMYGKYTQLCLHEKLQGNQLYQKGYELIENIKDAIPQKGLDLLAYVVKESGKGIAKEKQDKIFESHKKYAEFLNRSNKANLSPATIKACKKYQDYLDSPSEDDDLCEKIAPIEDVDKKYFDVIGDDLYNAMRAEIISHYTQYIQNGLRHNEFTGRLFPWEIRSVEIGHINNKNDNEESREANHKAFTSAHKDAIDFTALRHKLLKEIQLKGLEHYLIKEFIDAKNGILNHNNGIELNQTEKETILNKIKSELNKDIYVSSYQKGVFEKIDFLENSTVLNSKPKPTTLNNARYNKISNFLSGSTKTTRNADKKIIPTPKMLETARNAVKVLLATEIPFNLTGSKEDSGSLMIHLLKEKNPELSDIDIIKSNIDNFSIDSCMSILSSPCYLNQELKEKYEFNEPSNIKLQSQSNVLPMLDPSYGTNIYNSYADKNDALDSKRPLTSYSISGYTSLFDDMQEETQGNLKEAWQNRRDGIFKDRISNFIKEIKKTYLIDFSPLLDSDDISDIWNKIKEIEYPIDTENKHSISKGFFKALGGDWSRSTDIEDEKYLRGNFPESDWLQNPFGPQYRQHQTGRGALTPIAPSTESIEIVKKYIENEYKPFKNLADSCLILNKIQNRVDENALNTIFLNKETCAGPSGTAIRIMNLWGDILKKTNENPYIGEIPTKLQIEELCRVYLCGSRGHHTEIEVNNALDNRRSKTEEKRKSSSYDPSGESSKKIRTLGF